jgi:ABC-type nickel/cobalt efflux system permease component RcnA
MKIVQTYAQKQLQDILFVSFTYWQCKRTAKRLMSSTAQYQEDQGHNHDDQQEHVDYNKQYATTVQSRFDTTFEAFRSWYDAELNSLTEGNLYNTDDHQEQHHDDHHDDDTDGFMGSCSLYSMRQQMLQQQLCSQLYSYFYVLSPNTLHADARSDPLSIYKSESALFLLHIIQLLETSWFLFTESPPYSSETLVTLLQDIYGVQCAHELQHRREWFSTYYARVIYPWETAIRTIDANMSQRQSFRAQALREQGRRMKVMDDQYIQALREWESQYQSNYTVQDHERLETQLSRLRNYVVSYMECKLLVSMGSFFRHWFTCLETDAPRIHPEWSQWMFTDVLRSQSIQDESWKFSSPVHSAIHEQIQQQSSQQQSITAAPAAGEFTSLREHNPASSSAAAAVTSKTVFRFRTNASETRQPQPSYEHKDETKLGQEQNHEQRHEQEQRHAQGHEQGHEQEQRHEQGQGQGQGHEQEHILDESLTFCPATVSPSTVKSPSSVSASMNGTMSATIANTTVNTGAVAVVQSTSTPVSSGSSPITLRLTSQSPQQ